MKKGHKLGQGTFGIVYDATSPGGRHRYAVKRNLIEQETSFIGSLREIDVLSDLRSHPNIVKVEYFSYGSPFEHTCFSPLSSKDHEKQKDDRIHFIFAKADCDLHQYIHRKKPLNYGILKRFMVDILLGTEHMHNMGIIHRDLKPTNVLIFEAEKTARICDLGLAKPYTHQGLQTPNTVTSWYRAPEIALGYPNYDFKVDVWSLGCVLYEMVASHPYLGGNIRTSDDVLNTILSRLPKDLPLDYYRENITNNKWRKCLVSKMAFPHARYSIAQRTNLSQYHISSFQREAGPLAAFYDLLSHMLEFDWNQRWTVTQCLNHSFFDNFRNFISYMRGSYPVPEHFGTSASIIMVNNCVERRWGMNIAIDIFNNYRARKYMWYTHRTLFQAMDIYDRYLAAMASTVKPDCNIIESDLVGKIHTKWEAELYFYVCCYITIKYFSSIHSATTFEEVIPIHMSTEQARVMAGQFETNLIKDCLRYDIYRPTVYEAADCYSEILDGNGIRDLVVLYAYNTWFNGVDARTVYGVYRNELRGKTPQEIMVYRGPRPVVPQILTPPEIKSVVLPAQGDVIPSPSPPPHADNGNQVNVK